MVCAFKKHAIRRYLFLNLYMAASVVVRASLATISLTTMALLLEQYLYFYYYSDSMLTISLYFALS